MFFLLSPIFEIFSEDILQLFKNRSKGAQADQTDIKFVFCMTYRFLGFLICLIKKAIESKKSSN